MTEERNQLTELFAACWKDEALRARFVNDPKAVLAEYDMPVPDGMDVKVVENADNCVHITMPAAPCGHQGLLEAELYDAAEGTFNNWVENADILTWVLSWRCCKHNLFEEEMAEERKQLAELFIACWKDDALNARFMSDPKAVLAEYDMDTPEGVDAKVTKHADNCVHITMPAPPSGHHDLSDEELSAAAGGTMINMLQQ